MKRCLRLAFLVAAVGAILVVGNGRADAQVGVMRVGATVAPMCRLTTNAPTLADPNASVHVTCGRSRLRTLRVSSNGSRASWHSPESTALNAGGAVTFVIPQPVATVASRSPFLPSQLETRPALVVTLDF